MCRPVAYQLPLQYMTRSANNFDARDPGGSNALSHMPGPWVECWISS